MPKARVKVALRKAQVTARLTDQLKAHPHTAVALPLTAARQDLQNTAQAQPIGLTVAAARLRNGSTSPRALSPPNWLKFYKVRDRTAVIGTPQPVPHFSKEIQQDTSRQRKCHKA